MKKYFITFAVVLGLGVYAFSAYNTPPASSQKKIQFTDTVMSGYPDAVQMPSNSLTNSNGVFTMVIVPVANAAPRTNLTPNGVGQLVFDSTSNVLCIATGTVKTSWALVTATGTACSH